MVELDIDSNEIKRKFLKAFRYIKYQYIERKFLINIITLIVLTFIFMILYIFVISYHKNYSQDVTFSTDNFAMHINNVYLTNKDYKGNVITDNYLVIIDLQIRSFSSKGKNFDTVNAILKVGDNEYSHTISYRDYLTDIGTVYNDEVIYNTFDNYLLVYEIPKEDINEKMTFKYALDYDIFVNNLRPRYANVSLNPINLDTVIGTVYYDLGETSNFTQSIFNDISVNISEYEIASKFVENYQFCVNKSYCYASKEYITPSLGNEDKYLLKIKGTIDNYSSSSLYDFLNKYGRLYYIIDGTKKEVRLTLSASGSHISENTYYIEVPKEIEFSSEISLTINIRNYIYSYHLVKSLTEN